MTLLHEAMAMFEAAATEPTEDDFADAFAALVAQGDPDGDLDRLPLAKRLLNLTQLAQLPPPRWLIPGYLERNSLALLYGRRGSFKSFIAVDMLACATSGARWQGRAVQDYGNAVYVSAEGVGGLGKRFDAWRAHRPTEAIGDRLLILPEVLNLLSPVQVSEFCEVVKDLEPRLIVIDTLARCMPGGDENAAKDAGLVINHLDWIRRCTGACILVVHHSGKDATNGARGSSAYEAAVDTVLEVSAAESVVTVKMTKQKNHVELAPMTLVATGVGSSVVLTAHHPEVDTLTPATIETLRALGEIAMTGGVATSVWRLAVTTPERSFYVHLKRLFTAGLIENVGSSKMPRYQLTELGAATTATVLQ